MSASPAFIARVGASGVVTSAVLVLALTLRLPGMFSDFWLDEAWSYLLVRQVVSSPIDVLTRLHIDNNHPLNSWLLFAFGDSLQWTIYRLPSLLLGVGSIVFAGRILARRGRAHAMAAMIVVATSYPLIVYASEARGYAPMTFFLLLAIDALDRYFAAPGWPAAITFWAAVVLGLFSHLTFLHGYVAMMLWSAARERARATTVVAAIRHFVQCHAVPVTVFAALYLVFIRHLVVAGAEPAPLASVLAETVALTVGTPPGSAWTWIGLTGFVAGLVVGLRTLAQRDTGFAIFLAAGIVVVPAVAIWIELQNPLGWRFFPRYFLVAITLSLLLAGWAIGELSQRGAIGRRASAIFVTVFVAGNLWQVWQFAADGRGHYRDALVDMASATPGGLIRVSSDSDFRTGILLAFYQRHLPADTTVAYYPRRSPQVSLAQWRVTEHLEPTTAIPAEITDESGGRFQLRKTYPFYGLSGCQWSVYERVR